MAKERGSSKKFRTEIKIDKPEGFNKFAIDLLCGIYLDGSDGMKTALGGKDLDLEDFENLTIN